MSQPESAADQPQIPPPSPPEADWLGWEFDPELQRAIADFGNLPGELNYRQAHQALRSLVQQLDLQPHEATALDTEVQALEQLLRKLDETVVHIAVMGLVGRGKSSVLNALLGQPHFETGAIHGVTQVATRTPWLETRQAPSPEPETSSGSSGQRVVLPGLGRSRLELVDTPGLDEVDGAERSRLASETAAIADLILFVITGDITRVEYDALALLRERGKPIILVFNKVDQYPPGDRDTIYQTLRDQRLTDLVAPEDIVMTAAAPLVTTATRLANGQLHTTRQRGTPQIDALKQRILTVLHREGKSLIALNTALYADHLNDRLTAQKLAYREQAANRVIWQAVMTKATAIAVNPITAVDLVSGAVIDVMLLLTLSRLYGLPMTRRSAAQLLQKIAWGLGGIGIGEMAATLGLSSLKGLLGVATVATGGGAIAPYLAVAMTQAAIAGVATYGIGEIAKVYLVNGASWGAVGPKAVVSQILDSLDQQSVMNRIKDELRAKLQRSAANE